MYEVIHRDTDGAIPNRFETFEEMEAYVEYQAGRKLDVWADFYYEMPEGKAKELIEKGKGFGFTDDWGRTFRVRKVD